MQALNQLLEKIAKQKKTSYPFPDDLERYMQDFVPSELMKEETFQKVFKITTEELERVYKEGYGFYLNENYSQSITIFRWLVFFNPYVSKFWIALGSSLHMSKEYEKALHAYGITAILRTQDPSPHYYAYACYSLLEEREEAEKALEIAWEKSQSPIYEKIRSQILKIKKQQAICSEV
ncbi:MAG: SycD/LcrH family type III secretion system chaperone [Victivallaceae bacterium]